MATKTNTSSGRNITAELAYLTRTLKAPSLAAAVDRLAERARAESWTHEEFLAACLQREVAARESHGGEARIRTARFPPAPAPRQATGRRTPPAAVPAAAPGRG